MLIVNTTYQVSETHEEAWKQWVLNEYVPEVIRTNILTNPRFFRLLIENDPETSSYALQFEVEDLETLENWFEAFGKTMQNTMSNRFNDKILGFTTLMESVR
jgi:hypothetical protein